MAGDKCRLDIIATSLCIILVEVVHFDITRMGCPRPSFHGHDL